MDFVKLYLSKQLPLLPKENKLDEKDFKKIMKHLPNKDIFGSECVLWSGCVCNKDKPKKGLYVNYYIKEKKKTLHRLLYENFRDSNLPNRTYLEFSCKNPTCCCVNHITPKLDKKLNKDILEKKDLYKIDYKIDFT